VSKQEVGDYYLVDRLRARGAQYRHSRAAAAYPAALQGTNSRGLVSTGSLAEAVKSTEAI
jgi:hypothetical protein